MTPAAHRADCWERFKAAARAARFDDFGPARALIESVRQKHGEEAAQQQRRELNNFIKAGKA